MRKGMLAGLTVLLVMGMGAPAWACGGLIGPRGSVNLLRTTTLAAYHDGVEHYVTSFTFAGAGSAAFGSIVPLPGVPTKVEKGGDWTLQRLIRETQPQPAADRGVVFAEAARASAKVILETRIDALDITILEGGGDQVGEWAEKQGFNLPPDAPEVLDFYASRSQIFMAARFDVAAAEGRDQAAGDGTPIHLTIPTDNPWVPLRILALGKQAEEIVQADVYLLSEDRPQILPGPREGLATVADRKASSELLSDLRSDRGMEWVPEEMWLTHLALEASAGEIGYDLAIDADGSAPPTLKDAGLDSGGTTVPDGNPEWVLPVAVVGGVGALWIFFGLIVWRVAGRLAAG